MNGYIRIIEKIVMFLVQNQFSIFITRANNTRIFVMYFYNTNTDKFHRKAICKLPSYSGHSNPGKLTYPLLEL